MRSMLLAVFILPAAAVLHAASAKPNIVLVMTDDQGWGQTGYYHHPVLKTPNLDAMAANGLRLDRFYAGAPNCSPTRATVLTGRSNDRTGVHNHGYPLRRQEKTLPQALRQAGYATGHFGKWHLSGYMGPGVPILGDDERHPGHFGFDEWLSVTNFFDRNPIMSRQGTFEEFAGDSSEIVVSEALKFIQKNKQMNRPFLAVIWYGSPHSPFAGGQEDRAAFGALDSSSQHHYGELAAMDRSIGTLRSTLRNMNIAEDTLVWFCSDNGGLPNIAPGTVGGLRGFKNSVFEGGLRVPAVIEWPGVIKRPRVSHYPASTLDIFPTIAEIAGLPPSALLQPIDGMSIRALFEGEIGARSKPIPFRHTSRGALINDDYKLLTQDVGKDEFSLYNLKDDPAETIDLLKREPEVARRLISQFKAWNASVEASVAGRDYPEGRVSPGEPPPRHWAQSPEYQPYLKILDRPEYREYRNRLSRP